MVTIKEELQANARNLRERARRVEAAWIEAHGIERLFVRRGAEDRASRLAAKQITGQVRRHRDRQLGKLGPASSVRIIKPER